MQTIQFETSGFVFTTYGQLETTTCGVCGVPFAVPVELLAWSRKQPHRTFYCPAGHDLHYPGKTEAEKLRDQLESERRYSANVVARLDQTEASLSATKGVVTKLKKRAANGVCPCCNRSFPKLHEHMQTKHPDYVEPHEPGQLPRDLAPRRAEARAVLDAVLAFVGDDVKTYTEIHEGVGITTGHTSNVLNRMLHSGEIERVARGRYRKPAL